jgi:hypothetical protein
MLKTAPDDITRVMTQAFSCFFFILFYFILFYFILFYCGETSAEGSEHSGCPSTGFTDENIEKVLKIFISN